MHWLTEDQKDTIRLFATSTPDRETCGFVLESGETLQVPNIASDPVNEFEISAEHYARFDDQIKGIWHSHLRLAGFSPLDQSVMASDTLPWGVYCLRDNSFHQCDPTTTAPLEGRPFVFGVYDCYSLVSDALKQMGVELPAWQRGNWGEWNTPEFKSFDLEWHNVGRAVPNGVYQPGDILLMNLGDHPGHTDHVGVFTTSKHFMHHPVGGSSRLQTFGGYWARRLNWVIRPFALWSN